MELVYVTVIGAAIGLLARYVLPGRRTYGILLLPAAAAAASDEDADAEGADDGRDARLVPHQHLAGAGLEVFGDAPRRDADVGGDDPFVLDDQNAGGGHVGRADPWR